MYRYSRELLYCAKGLQHSKIAEKSDSLSCLLYECNLGIVKCIILVCGVICDLQPQLGDPGVGTPGHRTSKEADTNPGCSN